uniref:Complement component 1 Q subcomponent-binding protein, mitochondrial n=1 Tax=Tetraselmis sp. GSL018 TaxID=582737 RepID=A0A061S386_9CHLO|mmetsp:Transcript_12188/g.28923  ORF Transcript_12188/g.28923 Transcript_12188/m.28923 type:complete len:251 (-) Transcript_12188:352-1104(-)
MSRAKAFQMAQTAVNFGFRTCAARGNTATQVVSGLRFLSSRSLVGNNLPHHNKTAAPFFRSFAASATTDKEFANILRDELSHEKSDFVPSQELMSPPGGYVLDEKPGDGKVTLSKNHGSEEIVVSFEVNNQPDPDESTANEEGDVPVIRHFIVSVIKGENMITFECSSDGEGTNVEHMTFEPKEGFGTESTMYTGPVFYELDERVLDECNKYLAERYIFDLGPYIHKFIDEKEQKLYMEWLDNCAKFLEA